MFREAIDSGRATLGRRLGEADALPAHLARKLERLLELPLPLSGALRLACAACRVDWVFRRDGRGVAREEVATRLRRVIPRVPVRHWVFTLPVAWRLALAESPLLLRRTTRAFVSAIFAELRRAATSTLGLRGSIGCGSVTSWHRAGAALDLNPHVHALVLDGVYALDHGEPTFHPLSDPVELDAGVVGRATRAALAGLLRKRVPAPSEPVPEAALVRHRPARGPRVAGRERRGWPASERDGRATHDPGVHVGAPIAGDDRGALARACRYLVHPAFDLDALEPGAGDRLRYRLRAPFSDGTTHVEFDAAELVARLLAMTPTEPVVGVAYHGVLAPAAAQRWGLRPRQLSLPAIERRVAVRASRTAGSIAEVGLPCPRCGAALELVSVEESADGEAIGA